MACGLGRAKQIEAAGTELISDAVLLEVWMGRKKVEPSSNNTRERRGRCTAACQETS
jgi:hypothetical protein